MTKEERIAKAYGSKYESLKQHIDSNGWINEYNSYRSEFQSLEFDYKSNSMRPLELKGIENNNKWIKVNSENDLPKESGMFWTIAQNQSEVCANTFWSFKEREFTFDNGKITHYQPIEKPQLPIY